MNRVWCCEEFISHASVAPQERWISGRSCMERETWIPLAAGVLASWQAAAVPLRRGSSRFVTDERSRLALQA